MASRREVRRRCHLAIMNVLVDTASRVDLDVLPRAVLYGPTADVNIVDMSIRPATQWAEHDGLIVEPNRCFCHFKPFPGICFTPSSKAAVQSQD